MKYYILLACTSSVYIHIYTTGLQLINSYYLYCYRDVINVGKCFLFYALFRSRARVYQSFSLFRMYRRRINIFLESCKITLAKIKIHFHCNQCILYVYLCNNAKLSSVYMQDFFFFFAGNIRQKCKVINDCSKSTLFVRRECAIYHFCSADDAFLLSTLYYTCHESKTSIT